MTQDTTHPEPASFTGVPKIEDVMASLATQSIFDLKTLAQTLVTQAQQKAENEDDPGDVALLVTKFYVVWHDETTVE
jgi:hypothetical protein